MQTRSPNGQGLSSNRGLSRALLVAACVGALAVAACQSPAPAPSPSAATAAPPPRPAAVAVPSRPPGVNSAATLCNSRAQGPLGEAIGALGSGQTAANILPNLAEARGGIDACLSQMTRPSSVAIQCFGSARNSIQRAEDLLRRPNPNSASARVQLTSADRTLSRCISAHLQS
jgi:hypothetical protein